MWSNLVAQVTENAGNSRELFDWLQLLALPIVLALGPILLQRSNKAAKSAKEAAESGKAAAESVKPNGSGHVSLAALSEDILMHIGELRGEMKSDISGLREDMKDFKRGFDEHIHQDHEFMEYTNEFMSSTEQALEEIVEAITRRGEEPPTAAL